MDQSAFWKHFQITQSGGNRYESGPGMPESLHVLHNIALGGEKT